MLAELAEKRQEIEAACDRFGVASLDVFGSSLGERFEVGVSDVDFLVEFLPMDPYERVDAYFGLADALSEILDADVDLVMAGAVKNRYVAAEIERTRRAVYAP